LLFAEKMVLKKRYYNKDNIGKIICDKISECVSFNISCTCNNNCKYFVKEKTIILLFQTLLYHNLKCLNEEFRLSEKKTKNILSK
jgi:hypothetical protein